MQNQNVKKIEAKVLAGAALTPNYQSLTIGLNLALSRSRGSMGWKFQPELHVEPFLKGLLLMLWTASTTSVAMCRIAVAVAER